MSADTQVPITGLDAGPLLVVRGSSDEPSWAFYLLPRFSGPKDLDETLQRAREQLDYAAIQALVTPDQSLANKSTIVDFAVLGPIDEDGGAAAGLLAYSSPVVWRSHSRDCGDGTCLGWPDQKKADEHNEIETLEENVGMPRRDHKCNDVETGHQGTLDRWLVVQKRLSDRGSSHPFAKPITIHRDNVIAEWAKDKYSWTYNSGDEEVDDTRSTASTAIPDGGGNRDADCAPEMVTAQSGRSKDRRSQRYHPNKATATTSAAPKQQDIALGHILVRVGATGDFTMLRVIEHGQCFHHPIETNFLCRGHETRGKSIKSATALPSKDTAEWYEVRCKPGVGYNFEPRLIESVGELYISQKRGLGLDELVLEDSEAGHLADLIPGMTQAVHQYLEYKAETSEEHGNSSAPEKALTPENRDQEAPSPIASGKSLTSTTNEPYGTLDDDGLNHMQILNKRMAQIMAGKNVDKDDGSSICGATSDQD